MKNLKERELVIKFSIKLNETNLSPLRSGNISVRGFENDKEGFFITPSGKKYETLKPEDIVFLSLDEEKDFLAWFNSGKTHPLNGDFIKIFISTNGKPRQSYMLILHTQQPYQHTENLFHHFIT